MGMAPGEEDSENAEEAGECDLIPTMPLRRWIVRRWRGWILR